MPSRAPRSPTSAAVDTTDTVLRTRSWSRRSVLRAGTVGGLGLAVASTLAACGSSGPVATPGPQLVALFNPNRVIAAGIPQRLPFGLVDNGLQLTGDGSAVPARVLRAGEVIDASDVIARVVAHDHPAGTGVHQHSGLLRYYAVRTTLPEPGVYDVEIEIDGVVASAPVQAFDSNEIDVLLPGAAFPSLVTPTLADPSGVDELCTEPAGPCPFHTRTVADIMSSGEPMAVLVATPAFCSTAYCGPVLTSLIEAAPRHPTIALVHLEPYANAREVNGDLASSELRLADSMTALGLTYEPALFIVDRGGVLIDRIDNVFDLDELEPVLAALR